MGFSMTTLATISLLSFLAGSLPLSVLLYLQQRLHNQREEQWTRIFSVHSLMIPKGSMDAEQEKQPTPKKPDLRPRLHVPIPMPDELREAMRKRVKPA